MFTGIIEEIGSVKNVTAQGEGKRFQISASKVLEDLKIDQSVAVNGVCLTVVKITEDSFFADAVWETLVKSTLQQLKNGSTVNLERALRLSDRLGGHLVQGHVDGVGTVDQLNFGKNGSLLDITIPQSLSAYAISKGSIAIDGVSLTIAEKKENRLKIAVIPHTYSNTIFKYNKIGDRVNIEVDFFAKYIEQFLSKSSKNKITPDWLKQQGF
ncbi:riboflavin synthase [candidate division KSB1 bacterium]|nr:riboflavin synthase [candidate division KSB1 bacterium]